MDERARLRWQCRRGMLELDELLLAFLDRHYPRLDADQQRVFRRLLEESDQLLFHWLVEAPREAPSSYREILQRMRER